MRTMNDIARLGLGCMGLSHAYNQPTPREQAKQFLQAALDLGVDFFDTAIVYGFGENEKLLGEVLGGRHDVFVASKCGLTVVDAEGNTQRGINNDPDNIRKSVEQSLQRLQTDFIDLYYLHRWDKKTPIEECVGVLAQLKQEGKIGGIGLSEVSAATLRRAAAEHPIMALQSEYSLWTRDPENNGVLDTCQELGVKFVAFSPMGRGFLSGKAPDPTQFAKGDLRAAMPRFEGENYQRNKQLLPAFEAVAAEVGCTPAQLALAWVINQPYDIYAIPGTTKLKHLENNWGAKDIKLSAEVLHKLDTLINDKTVAGQRYNDKTMKELENN